MDVCVVFRRLASAIVRSGKRRALIGPKAGRSLFYCRATYCDLAATGSSLFLFLPSALLFLSWFFSFLTQYYSSPNILRFPSLSLLLIFLQFFLAHPPVRPFDLWSSSISADAQHQQMRQQKLRSQDPDVSVSDLVVGISASPGVSDKVPGLWRIGGAWVDLVEPRLGVCLGPGAIHVYLSVA